MTQVARGLLLPVVACLTGGASAATPGQANVETVFAAFTVNLIRFITWPAAALGPADAPFVVGTFPRDPINYELDAAVRGEMVAGHPVRTMRLNTPADVRKCHVVFISRGIADPGEVLAEAAHRPILTISTADGFLKAGGHVRFVAQTTHTQLQISADNLRASGLEARAQLLRLAATP